MASKSGLVMVNPRRLRTFWFRVFQLYIFCWVLFAELHSKCEGVGKIRYRLKPSMDDLAGPVII